MASADRFVPIEDLEASALFACARAAARYPALPMYVRPMGRGYGSDPGLHVAEFVGPGGLRLSMAFDTLPDAAPSARLMHLRCYFESLRRQFLDALTSHLLSLPWPENPR